jgi:hypothetical protein
VANASSYVAGELRRENTSAETHLPCEKRFLLNDSRLHNFLSRENSPGDYIPNFLAFVTFKLGISSTACSEQGDVSIPFCARLLLNPVQKSQRAKKLDKGFLEDVSIFWTPPNQAIRGWDTVECRLASDRPQAH